MPTEKITQTTLAKITPTGKDQFIRDTTLPGFGIKVSASGKATYIVERRKPGGRNVRKKVGEVDLLPLDQARIAARDALLQISKGVDIVRSAPEPEPEPESLAAALAAYVKGRKHRLREATIYSYEKAIRLNLKDWLPLPAQHITPLMVSERFADLKATHSQSQAAKVMRYLKAVLNSVPVSPNPVRVASSKFGLDLTSSTRSRFLDWKEISTIMGYQIYKKDPFADLIMFYMLTGCRLNEALNLRKTDYKGGLITFKDTKTKTDHIVPAAGVISTIVEKAIFLNEGDRVFGLTDHQFKNRLAKFKALVSLKDHWTAHDLRRTFTEHAFLAGVSEFDIDLALNHKRPDVTSKRYASAKLAKIDRVKHAYLALQRQFEYYWAGTGDAITKAPHEY